MNLDISPDNSQQLYDVGGVFKVRLIEQLQLAYPPVEDLGALLLGDSPGIGRVHGVGRCVQILFLDSLSVSDK
jgi:hypothetical protein